MADTLTRRDFLRKVVVGTVAGAAVGFEVSNNLASTEKLGIDLLRDFISNPNLSRDALIRTADVIDNKEVNSKFRDISSIVNEGISDYEKSGGKAFFKRVDGYQGSDFYNAKINEFKNSIGILPKDPRELASLLTNSFPDDLQRGFLDSNWNISSYLDALPKAGGMFARLTDSGKGFTSDEVINRVKAESKSFLMEAKNFVEDKVRKKGEPVSSSVLFTYFLDKNEGDISKSLIDTFGFLKFMARNDFDNGEFIGSDSNRNKRNIVWMKVNILDEFGSSNYAQAKNGDDSINLIGKPYHAWNLVSLLSSFPPEVVTEAGIFRQLTHLDAQGPKKLSSDLRVLADLSATEDVLLKYAR